MSCGNVRSAIRACALPLIALCLSGSAAAGARPVSLGEITVSETRSPELVRSFRRTVERAFQRVDLARVESPDRYVLSATLVAMETRSTGDKLEITCRVSAALRKQGGELHALMNGKARAEALPTDATAAEHGAMQAAVESALRRVPEAIR